MKVRYTLWVDDQGNRDWHCEGADGPSRLREMTIQFQPAKWPIGTTIEVDLPADGDKRLEDRFREILRKKAPKDDTPGLSQLLDTAVKQMLDGRSKQRTLLEAQLLAMGLAVPAADEVDSPT